MKVFLSALALLGFAQFSKAQTNEGDTVSTATVTGQRIQVKAGGFYAEPFLSLGREDSSMRSGSIAETSGRVDGGGFGARIGVHALESMFIGVDARYARSRIADSFYESADGNLYNYGPMIGAQMPWYGARAWASYVLGGEFDPRSGRDGFDVRFRDPRGYRVGAGIHYKSASVNLEWQDLVYDTTNIQSLGRMIAEQDSRIDFVTRGFTLSVSFPVDL